MEQDFKKSIEKSKEAMKKLEGKVGEVTSELSESATEFWGSLQKSMEGINKKLEGSYKDWGTETDEARLQANLGAMEANDKMKEIKESLEGFSAKVSKNAQEGFDVVAEKAQLAKKEAEVMWDEKAPIIQKEFAESKEKVSKMAVEAVDEITHFFDGLVSKFSEKKEADIKEVKKEADVKEVENDKKA